MERRAKSLMKRLVGNCLNRQDKRTAHGPRVTVPRAVCKGRHPTRHIPITNWADAITYVAYFALYMMLLLGAFLSANIGNWTLS